LSEEAELALQADLQVDEALGEAHKATFKQYLVTRLAASALLSALLAASLRYPSPTPLAYIAWSALSGLAHGLVGAVRLYLELRNPLIPYHGYDLVYYMSLSAIVYSAITVAVYWLAGFYLSWPLKGRRRLRSLISATIALSSAAVIMISVI